MIVLLVFFLGFGEGKRCHGKHGDVGLNYTFAAIDYDKVCCKTEQLCRNYRGTKSVTKSGLKCQAWNSDTPHPHIIKQPQYPTAEENYCRNFVHLHYASTWCHTMSPQKPQEFCDIPKCSALTLHDRCLATPGMLAVQRRLIQVSKQLMEVLKETKATESQIEEVDTKVDNINKRIKDAQQKCETSKTWITATRNQASQLKKDLDEAKKRLEEFDSKAMASVGELQKLVAKIHNKKKHHKKRKCKAKKSRAKKQAEKKQAEEKQAEEKQAKEKQAEEKQAEVKQAEKQAWQN